MKIKCSFTILLMVKILKEFKNPKGFERMTCGGIIGTTSTYFGTLLIIVIERKKLYKFIWFDFQRLFQTRLCHTVCD